MGYQLIPLERLEGGTRFSIPPSDDIYTLLEITEKPSLPIRHEDGSSWRHHTVLYLGRTALVKLYENK